MPDLPVSLVNELRAWNETTVDFPALPLPALLRQRAELCPDAIAVQDLSESLSYAELVAQAHRLARYLQGLGVQPGTRVACALPRGVPAIVVQVAVFALGAVHVPINAAYPEALLSRLLADVDAQFMVAMQDQEVSSKAKRIDLDDPSVGRAVAALAGDRLERDPMLKDLAYVIHTSGTSGRPKPVAVSHGAISNSMQAYAHRYSTPITRLVLVSPMTVDACLAGIWWTLLSGGCLRLLSPDTAQAVGELVSALSDGETSHTVLTPSLYRAVLSSVGTATTTPSALRQVMVAGEQCPPDLVSEHYRVLSDVDLVNGYGPTEAAVWCASATLQPGTDVVVGTPIANTELWVLDALGQIMAPGEFGEVCVGGVSLADGYLGNPELTRARFVPHPLDSRRVVYRTGDLGRWRADGRVELRGRLDDQIKIHGYRVEPDGVADALRTHPGVRDAVVTAHDGLIAYVVPEWDEQSAAEQLRQSWSTVIDDLDHGDQRIGWTSSYTGERLSDQDMDEWVADTVRLAEEGNPRSLVELGCGTGMLLTKLAPGRDRVVGLDMSRPTLDALAETLDTLGLHHVELRHGDARDVNSLSGFDLVLCNSVTPYFSGPDQLAAVLSGALRATTPEGRVVFGDVKDLGLEDALHAAVVLASADDDVPVATLRELWRRRIDLDPHFLVDPRWFLQAAGDRRVEVRPRQGAARNEMNDFRFDAVVFPGPANEIEIAEWVPWPGSPEALRALLTGDEPIGVLRVPNQRTAGACVIRAQLTSSDDEHTAGSLRQLAAEADSSAVRPEQLTALAAELGWTVRFSRASGWTCGGLDAAFLPPSADGDLPVRWPQQPCEGELTNAPIRRHVIASAIERLLPDLREHAAGRLPEHERPSTYVVLTELPLTESGKLDRAGLVAPPAERPALSTPYVRPVLPIECRVAEILAELLRLDRVGVHDNFVELGGDSLLAVRAAVRLRTAFGVDLPVRTVFDAPTVVQLAALLADSPHQTVAPQAATIQESAVDQETLPLSPAQMLLWAYDLQFNRGLVPGPDFTLGSHYRISGPLDTNALARAVDEVVNRHEALRTTLQLVGEPEDLYQVIDPPTTEILRVVTSDRADIAAVLAELQESTPLLPAQGKVFAAELVSGPNQEHLLSLRMHHMVSDGHSVGVVEREISQLYQEICSGHEAALPGPPSYRGLLGTSASVPAPDDLLYWTQKVAGCGPVELVPPWHLETVTEPHATLVRSLVLPAPQAQPFLRFARSQRVTLHSALYAVLCTLIAADTGDRDVRLLTVSAARHSAELERTVGLVLDAVLVRHHLRPGLPVGEAFTAAGGDLCEALRHDSIPLLGLCQLLPDMLAAFGPSQSVVFEVLAPVNGLSFESCSIRHSDQLKDDFAGRMFQLPAQLAVIARPEGDALRLAAVYDPAFVPVSYVDSLLARMRDVVVACVEPDSQPLDQLALPDPWLTALWEQGRPQ
ncbi:non-ribosomal peptide synthetase [Streptomyces sp. TLI_185]|uniref:non-ribosomal peptide synthetase n=1 Tax=Streptomyces sp. TLI_185 TaxID=2485151 RepID=UPI000F516387|nr:non-ribosomal peptide synthetase [Streptomyces sp. TLI_185]RPF39372.1 amino acid adenylation domain-containing protein [Streptomyces sp. TLI_185]